MAEQQFTDEYEPAEADAAEQSLPELDPDPDAATQAPGEPEVPMEADPADAAEQAVAVPVDEEEYR